MIRWQRFVKRLNANQGISLSLNNLKSKKKENTMKMFAYLVTLTLLVLSPSIAIAGTYDGNYNFKIKTTRGSCTASSGVVKVADNEISGTLLSEGQKFKIYGKVKDDGTIKGKISGGVATFKGNFENGKAIAKWRNRFGCAGSILIR